MIADKTSLRAALAAGLILLTPSIIAATTPSPRPAAARPTTKPAASAVYPTTPEGVVKAFLQAQSTGDDEKAYSYFSLASKKKKTLKEWSDQGHQVRGTFSAITLVAGEALLIGGAENVESKVATTSSKPDQATITVTRMLPVKSTLYVTKENGKWVIDIQRSLMGDEAEKPATPPPPPPTTPTPTTPAPPPDPTPQCRASLQQVGTAFQVYLLDHNSTLPDASKWTDALAPYLQNQGLLKCPPDSTAESSYAMNSALSGKKLSEIEDPSKQILLYESTTTTKNVSGTGATLAATAPHPGGYLVLYANGTAALVTSKPVIH